MRSFGEWKSLEENMNAAALRNTLGGSSVKVDPVLRSKLRTKILDIAKEFPESSPSDLFQNIMAVVGSLITHGSGNTASSSQIYKQLNQNPEQQQQAQQNQQIQNSKQ